MTEEPKKDEKTPEPTPISVVETPQDVYRKKIGTLLTKVTKGEEIYPKPKPVVENPVYKKIKELGIQKGITEFFKIEESQFDVPQYVSEEIEDQIVGTQLHRIKIPSSYPDVDNYWKSILPHLKRIGQVVPIEGEEPGALSMKVVSSKGEEEVLHIVLVRDSEHGDKPTLVFEYQNRDDITPEEVFKFIERCGLKPDRVAAKTLPGIVVVDIIP